MKHSIKREFHGMTGTRLYKMRQNMLNRCYNKSTKEYSNYGGRGITVYKEWLEVPSSFFKWAIKNGYSDDLSLDRIDVDGNYEPSNCRFISMKEQQWNKTNTVEYNGLKAKDIIEAVGVSGTCARNRLKKGESDLLFSPKPKERIAVIDGVEYNLRELSEKFGINHNTVQTRYNKGFRNEDLIDNLLKRHERKVVQYDKLGNLIQEFQSIKEASKQTGIRYSGIVMTCRGKRKSCGGYVWRYLIIKEL